MVDRLQYNAPSIFTQRASEISYDDGTVQHMNQLSGTFLSVSEKAHKAELSSLVARAQKDGALEGLKSGENFRPNKKKGLVHRTYNDSAIQSATMSMSMKSQQNIQRIAMQNPGNPSAQHQAMTSWADSFAEELPQDMIEPFRSSFEKLAQSQITTANKEFGDIRQGEAITNFNDYETQINNSLEMFGPKIFDDGDVGQDAAVAVETLRKNYVEMLAMNGPGAEYSVGGYKIPEGQGRSNAFTVEEIGKKIKEFDKRIVSTAIKGDFLQDLEAGRGVSAYFNFVKGITSMTTVGVDGSITQMSIDEVMEGQDKDKVASFMRTHISTLNSFEAAQDKKSDRVRVQYNEGIIDQALQSSFNVVKTSSGQEVVEGNPDVLRMQYLAAVNDDSGLVRLETIETLKSLMETVGNGDIEDPAILSQTKLSIINRETQSVSSFPEAGLGDKGRGEMVQMLRQINAGQHWSNSKRYSTMLSLGKSSLAPEAATGFALFSDPNKESAADYAEFQERLMTEIISAEGSGVLPVDINAMPVQGEFDIQGRAQEIITEIKERRKISDEEPAMVALNTKIKELEGILNNTDNDEEAIKAREELRRVLDEKVRMQSANQYGGNQ